METPRKEIILNIEVEEQATRSITGKPILIDERVRLLASKSTIGLSIVQADYGTHEGRKTLYLKMRCLGSAAPKCSISWLQLRISFPNPENLRAEDLQPELVKSEHPVKITTTYSGGFSLEVLKVKLGPEAKAEKSRETQYYFSEIRGSGKTFNYAEWVFETAGEEELYVNRDLHLLLSYPARAEGIESKITMRAHVIHDGLLGYVPILGRTTEVIERGGSW
jgi:hypothetical protein